MKRYFSKLLLIVFLHLAVGNIYGQETDMKEILRAAEAGYPHYLAKIPVGQESFYGFNNREEFSEVKVGKPYKILTFRYNIFKETAPNLDNFRPTGEWRIPLTVNGVNRVLISVAKINKVWQVVSIGSAGLAKELIAFEKGYSLQNQQGFLLSVFQLDCDFFLVPQNNSIKNPRIYPLASARMMLNKTSDEISSYSVSQIMSMIREKSNDK